MKPTEIFELIKNNLSEFETVIKNAMDWHYLELNEKMLENYSEEESLEESSIHINFNVYPSEWQHCLIIGFVDRVNIITEKTEFDMNINFMGNKLFMYYENELLDCYNKMAKKA